MPTSSSNAPSNNEGSDPDGRTARAQRRRQERREAILASAKVVFRAKGYHPTSIGDIIEEANIARGTFYLYFTNKEDIFRALLEEFLGAIRGQVRRISTTPDAPPPIAQLRANFRRILNAVIANEEIADIMLRDPVGFDAQSRSELDQFSDSVLRMAEDALRVGQSLGLVRRCDVHLAAVAALGGVQQTLRRMLQVRALGGDSPLAEHEHVANELISFVLAAVGSPRLTASLADSEAIRG